MLGCDSLFEFEGELFGKPKDSNEAFMRWKKMSTKSGLLHTGHVLLSKPIQTEIGGQVEFKSLSKCCRSTS